MAAPTWNTPTGNLGTVYENSSFVYAISASNVTSYYLISGTLPTGLTMNISTGLISGNIPPLKNAGTFTFTVRATNSSGISDRSFNIIVLNRAITWNVPANLTPAPVLHKSFFSTLISATDLGNPTVTYQLVSGQLPNGLTFDDNGLLSGYLTSISDVISITYNFTIQANGVSTSTQAFTFTVTSLGDPSPQWNTIGAYQLSPAQGVVGGDVGNIFANIPYSFQLESIVPAPGGPAATTYTIISGTLPIGMTLASNGLLSGTITTQDSAIFPFTVKISDGVTTSTRVFYIKTNFFNQDLIYWLIDETTFPVDLASMAAGDTIDFTVGSTSFQITKSAFQIEYNQGLLNTITAHKLPLATTLLVDETSSGTYAISKFYADTLYDSFELDVISSSAPFIFSLGTVAIGDKCTLQMNATTEQSWVRYKLSDGSSPLPAGLFVDENTGSLEGQVLDQAVGTYAFNITAYNYSVAEALDFSLDVIANSDSGPNKLAYRLSGYEKLQWITLENKDLIPAQSIYRSSDSNYGIQTASEIVILPDVLSITTDQVFAALQNEIPGWLQPSTFITTPVVDNNQNVICECVVLKFTDSFRRAAISHQVPVGKNPAPNPTVTVYPGGLDAIREIFLNNNYAYDTYTDWMNYYFSSNIANNSFFINNVVPQFLTGDKVVFTNQSLPNPFENGTNYYVIPLSATEFQLAASESDAFAGTRIAFDVNEAVDTSGTIQTFIAGTPIVYMNTGTASAVASAYNGKINLTPYGYYTILGLDNQIQDTFFQSFPGHNLNPGDPIIFDEEFVPEPFNYGSIYYAIVVDPITFKLAATQSDAAAGNPITITSATDDITGLPYVGAFKKIILTENNTIQVEEVNLRFKSPTNVFYLDDHFSLQQFTATESTNVNPALDTGSLITLTGHDLDTGQFVTFNGQVLTPELSNGVEYYVIRVTANTFRLSATYLGSFNNTFIQFSQAFSGLLAIDTGEAVFINTRNQFHSWATYTDSRFTTNQTSPVELGDIVQIIQTVSTLPSPFAVATNYYVIPMTSNNFQLATSLTNAQNGVFITFANDFRCDIVLESNNSELNWKRYF